MFGSPKYEELYERVSVSGRLRTTALEKRWAVLEKLKMTEW